MGRGFQMNEKTYAGMTFVEPGTDRHLGGKHQRRRSLHLLPAGFCLLVWNYVIERFCVKSVLDLGSDYWGNHVSDRGYNLLHEDTNRIRLLAAQERAIYMHNSGLLFHRK
jgi:hypothetical protein